MAETQRSDPPGGDLRRPQFADRSLAEGGNRLSEQPAQLFDRHRLHVVLHEVRLHQLGERQRPRDSSLAPQPLKLSLQRLGRVPLRGEPASLHPPRASATEPVAVRPQWLSVPTRPLNPKQLTLLRHRAHPYSSKSKVIVISARCASNGHTRKRAVDLCTRARAKDEPDAESTSRAR
jgi:hypothetical protein